MVLGHCLSQSYVDAVSFVLMIDMLFGALSLWDLYRSTGAGVDATSDNGPYVGFGGSNPGRSLAALE